MRLETPMAPPAWALLERELLRANARACEEFFARYFDDRGYLECVERWGGDDGPDDAIENVNDWPVLYALGGADSILTLFKKAWEGHLRQYTEAKTTEVPFARDGMYYKEFPVMFDWLHHGEGLSVFDLEGLCDPHDARFRQRVTRFAGFYLNDDPGAPNYDPKQKIIRSLFNGSRGPLLRKATALDWAGDPIEVEHRFRPGHGEHSYPQMLEHFKDYNDIVGDNPMNLGATIAGLNAYMLTHEARYKNWILEYVDAWRQRMIANGGIIPTNIGLDGKIGGACGGKWYGGVYGWGFTVLNPGTKQPVHRNNHHLALNGFGNAFLLTGDDRFLDAWRKQIDAVNSHSTVEERPDALPAHVRRQGLVRLPARAVPARRPRALLLVDEGSRPPARARLRLARIPGRPEPRLSRDGPPRRFRRRSGARSRPCDATRPRPTPGWPTTRWPTTRRPSANLVHLMLGGLPPKHQGEVLQARVRYFDPVRRRPGLPDDVAALVDSLKDDSTSLVLVNLNQTEPRTVIVQGGGYGEHLCEEVTGERRTIAVHGPRFRVLLATRRRRAAHDQDEAVRRKPRRRWASRGSEVESSSPATLTV